MLSLTMPIHPHHLHFFSAYHILPQGAVNLSPGILVRLLLIILILYDKVHLGAIRQPQQRGGKLCREGNQI